MSGLLFQTAKDEEIKAGQVTDVYFCRTLEILRRRGVVAHAVAEVVLKSFPAGWGWGVLAGIEEVAALLRDLPVTVRAFPEGAIFGARRMHPALAPMIERNAYLGGCDGVAVVKSADILKLEPSGTMPHSLMLMPGDTVTAAQAFDEIIDRAVRRVVLIDTFGDEKAEAVRVAEALRDRLYAVRLDTPASRRGDLVGILCGRSGGSWTCEAFST